MPTKDAWKQVSDLWAKFSKRWEIRNDLKVTALGPDRAVRLEVGISSKMDPRRLVGGGHAVTTRNVITMRELGEALIAACDFVDEVNPEWAKGHQ